MECQVCGAKIAEGDMCNLCKRQMETHDTSDIRQRVAEHVSDYELINAICNHYKITDYDFFDSSRKQPGARARALYIFCAVRNLGLKNKYVADKLGVSAGYASGVVSHFTKRIKNELFVNKFSHILNISK